MRRMSKRPSDGRDGGCTAKFRQPHLYLVFDDWSGGYSVRKVDLSGSDSGDGGDRPLQQSVLPGEVTKPRLVFRLEAPHGLPHCFASAFGTSIMNLHPRKPITDQRHKMPESLCPILDVHSRGIFFGPRPEADSVCPIYIPMGDMLFALASGSLEMLSPPPEPTGHNCVWSWCKLENPPFQRQEVTSYAVHPEGLTILVSTVTGDTGVTYALDMNKVPCVWTSLGNWRLPFTGFGHFDVKLNAYVGLSNDPDTLGHLCSCDALSPDVVDGRCLAPTQKLSKERLFSVNDPAEVHMGATLVYLGRRRFCLVQCIGLDDGSDQLQEKEAQRRLHLLRLITFSLKNDSNGDLTTGKSRRIQYCKVPKASTEFVLKRPVAFWL